MFGIVNRLGVGERKKQVFIINSYDEEYILALCELSDVEFSVSGNWAVPREEMPRNIRYIKNASFPHGKYAYDYIMCFGQAESCQIANKAKEQLRCPVIHVKDTLSSTKMLHPFSISNNRFIPSNSEKTVCLRESLVESNQEVCIPRIIKTTDISQKQEKSICFAGHIAPNLLSTYHTILKDYDCVPFSKDSLSSCEIFLDTTVGMSRSCEEAMKNGCKIVAPYSEDMSHISGDFCFLYKGFDEIKDCLEKAFDSKVDKHIIAKDYNDTTIDREQFIERWKEVLS